MISSFQAALVAFWSSAAANGQSPWQWYAQYLQEQMQVAITRGVDRHFLTDPAAALARLVQAYPWQEQRANWVNSSTVSVENLQVDLTAGWQLDPNLASALLIERSEAVPEQSFTLLYTLIGRLLAFDSRERLLEVIGAHWPERLGGDPQIRLWKSAAHVFEAQALGVLDQHLRLIDSVSITYLSQRRATALSQALDRMTSMLAQRIDTDHPGAGLNVADLRVVNYQVTPAALPGPGVVVIDNSVREVRFSLAQLAIANLGLLRPGRVAVESAIGGPVPAWLDERYLRTLVTDIDIDIGASYPLELQRRLLDDPTQVSRRQHLLIPQLRAQLPAQAMELHLRKQGLSQQGVEAVKQALAPEPQGNPPHWSVRPLAFKRSADASSDLPRSAWLIEDTSSNSQLCLLYRPLHAEPLLEFLDRLALFAAISAPGPLQDDLLERLPALDRRVYAHGGFLGPHLFYPLEDTWAVPFGRPAPVLIDRQPEMPDRGEALYRACVDETIRHFREHSSSSDQTRWQRWQDLGWLLLNTLLPFAEGPVARAAWLVQMDVALAEVIDEGPGTSRSSSALVTLVSNIAILLLSHAMEKLGLARAAVEPGSAGITEPVTTPRAPQRCLRYCKPVTWPARSMSAGRGPTCSCLPLSAPRLKHCRQR